MLVCNSKGLSGHDTTERGSNSRTPHLGRRVLYTTVEALRGMKLKEGCACNPLEFYIIVILLRIKTSDNLSSIIKEKLQERWSMNKVKFV